MSLRGTALIACVIALTGCSRCDGDEPNVTDIEHRVTAERGEVREPETLAFEGTLAGGRETLASIRALVPGPLAEAVPATPGALIARSELGEPLAARVPEDATVFMVGVELDGVVETVMGVRIEPGPDPAIPLPGIQTTPGAPEGGLWIGEPDDADAPAAMIQRDALLLGETRRAVEAAATYMLFGYMERDESADGIETRLATPMLESLAQSARRSLEARAVELLTVSAAMGGRGSLLAGGITRLRTHLYGWLERADDIVQAHASIRPTANGVSATFDIHVEPQSALASELGATPSGSLAPLRHLARATAFAWLDRIDPDAPRGSVRGTWTDALGLAAGTPLALEDREALRSAADAVTAGRGTDLVLTAGGDGESAWALLVMPEPRAPTDMEPLLAAAALPQLAASVRTLGGCEDDARILSRLASARPTEGITRRAAPVCVGSRVSVVEARADGAQVVGLMTGPVAADVVTLGGPAAEPTPRLESLDALGGAVGTADVLGAFFAVPSRLGPAAAIVSTDDMRSLARDARADARDEAVAGALLRTDQGARLELRASAAAIEDASSLLE